MPHIAQPGNSRPAQKPFAKGRLSPCKRCSFTVQKTVNRRAKGHLLQNRLKQGVSEAVANQSATK